MLKLTKPRTATLVVGLCVTVLYGCNLGNAPSGPSQADYQHTLDTMTPQQRLKWIQGSPLNPDKKAKMIADLKAKTGAK